MTNLKTRGIDGVEIKTLIERRRGCGYRKGGGLYLVADGPGVPCCKLPIPTLICPTCRGGIKPSRGWTWIDLAHFVDRGPCLSQFAGCPLSPEKIHLLGLAGLVWVGEKFYTPASFVKEAQDMGISRRIPHLPKSFRLGETWVALGHRKVFRVEDQPGKATPGIFYLFKPQRVEYVVKGDETPEQLERLAKRGVTPVKVIPLEGSQGHLEYPEIECSIGAESESRKS
jgi:hypothetical protein